MRTLFAVAALSFSLPCFGVASEPPVPSIGKDIQKQNAKPTKDKSQSDVRLYSPLGTKESPLIVEPVTIPKSQAEADHQHYEHHEKPTLDRWLTYGTVALAGITAVLAYFTYGLWSDARHTSKQSRRDMRRSLAIGRVNARATKIAADAAKKSADASLLSLRPWLTCEAEFAGPLTYTDEGDARFQFVFKIKNVGHSPAMAIRFDPFLTLNSPKHEPAIIRLQRMAELNRGLLPRVPIIFMPGNVTIEGADLGLVLFPGETYTIKYGLRIKRDEIVKSCEDTKPSMNFWPILGGLVAYSYALASVRADTAFVHEVKVSDELFFKLDEALPMEKLGIARSDFAEGFAT